MKTTDQAKSTSSEGWGAGHGCFKFLGVLCVAMVSLVISSPLRAALFEDSMSMETTPIEFEMAAGRYRIPRNYIYSMDNWAGGPQKNVSLRMVVPDLKPFSPETETCMLRTARPPCRVYDIELVNDFTLSEVGFENSRGLFRNKRPKKGVYGFELYEIGPENAREELYRKDIGGRVVVFSCLLSDIEQKTYRICDHVSRTDSGVYFYYHFSGDRGLKDAVEVDLGIQNLIDSFYVGGK